MYRNTADDPRRGKLKYAAMLRSSGWDINCAPKKEGAARSTYSLANKIGQETFRRLATLLPSAGLDDAVVDLSHSTPFRFALFSEFTSAHSSLLANLCMRILASWQ